MQKCFFPPFLPEGGCIALVSPSRWAVDININAYRKALESHGYKVKISPESYQKDGILAGSDSARADALMAAFMDPECQAVFCIRGGTGANLILDYLDYDLIAANPKPLVGFSDITILLNAISSRTGMVTYHGPMSHNFLPECRHVHMEEILFTLVGSKGSQASYTMDKVDVAREGIAQGRLVGGNLTLLETALGTPYEWNADNVILFIEEVSEPLYKIERSLVHLKQAGKLKEIKALLVGQMVDVLDLQDDLDSKDHDVYGRDLKDFVLKHIPSDIPVAFEVPCGHGDITMTFPIGADVKVTLKENECEMAVCS